MSFRGAVHLASPVHSVGVSRARRVPFSHGVCIPFAANKPMICHQIEALKEAGCDEVVLAINYRPQVMMDFLKGWEEKLGIKITCSQEEEPMGTAGPLALAKDILNKDGKGAPFFVLNSDVICEYPLKEMMDQVRAGYCCA